MQHNSSNSNGSNNNNKKKLNNRRPKEEEEKKNVLLKQLLLETIFTHSHTHKHSNMYGRATIIFLPLFVFNTMNILFVAFRHILANNNKHIIE